MNASSRPTNRIAIFRAIAPAVMAGVLAAACTASAATPAPIGVPIASPTPAPTPVSTIRPNASPTAAPTPVTPTPRPAAIPPKSAADAVALVLAQDSRFAGIRPKNPDLIGQSAWYEVGSGVVGWVVTIQIGWGDCPAGCISKHTWTYSVDPAGTVTKTAEGGDPVQGGGGGTNPGGSGGSSGGTPTPITVPDTGGPFLVGRVTASPVCPVMRNPPDPACNPRPVEGATIVATDASGNVVGSATTDAGGVYRMALPTGMYTVAPQPVAGLMGTPAAAPVLVPDDPTAATRLDFGYDTGIR